MQFDRTVLPTRHTCLSEWYVTNFSQSEKFILPLKAKLLKVIMRALGAD